MQVLDHLAHSHAVWALAVFAVMIAQSLLAENIILAMKQQGYKLGWFFSFLNAAASFIIAYMKSDKKFIQGIQNKMTAEHIITGAAFSLSQGMSGTSQLFLRFNTVQIF